MKVIISYNGDFYTNQTAALVSENENVTLIQSYVPGRIATWFSQHFPNNWLSKKIKSANRRRANSSKMRSVNSLWVEVYYYIMKAITRDAVKARALWSEKFGRYSCKYIKDAQIFHVRSGSGQGGAIACAKRHGMITLVDHSIAHEDEMISVLKPEYEKHGIEYQLDSTSAFWNLVIQDCKHGDYILVNSDYVKRSFVEHGYEADKIKVVYLGVRKDWFGIKKSYDIQDKIKLLFVGGVTLRKGCYYILESLQLLRDKGIPFEINMIGNTSELTDIIKKYDTKEINFIPSVPYDELKNYYANNDAFLFPSLSEGSTRAGMEAMGAGMPVILTDNCGNPVEDGVNGIIVPIKDSKAIADAVEKLYKSKELREHLGRAAADTIATKYTWEKYAENISKVYREIIKD